VAPLIDVWLDSRWQHAIVPSQLMLLLGVPFVTIYVSASLLLALNRQNTEAVICAVHSVGTVAAVAMTAPFGTAPAVVAILVVALITAPATIVVMWRQCGLELRDTVWPQMPPLLAACLMGAVVLALRATFEARFGLRVGLLLEVLAGVVVYGALLGAMMAAGGPRLSPRHAKTR
jgi:O-antigen/teichoic acid export membrane protein